MSSSFWLMWVESHDLSQAQKERTGCRNKPRYPKCCSIYKYKYIRASNKQRLFEIQLEWARTIQVWTFQCKAWWLSLWTQGYILIRIAMYKVLIHYCFQKSKEIKAGPLFSSVSAMLCSPYFSKRKVFNLYFLQFWTKRKILPFWN